MGGAFHREAVHLLPELQDVLGVSERVPLKGSIGAP